MKIIGIINPFLLIITSIVYFTSTNYQYLSFKGFFLLLILVLGIFSAIVLMIYFSTRSLDRTIKISTYFAFLWFIYPIIMLILSLIPILAIDERFTFISFILFLIILMIIILKTNKLPLGKLFQQLLLIFSIIMISMQLPNLYKLYRFVYSDVVENFEQEKLLLSNADPKITPHIIYIVPDRYASNKSLLKYFGFNNSEFTKQLKERGFYTWENQYANYPNTFMSLASMLNMNYLDKAIQHIDKANTNYNPFFKFIIDNQVQNILREHGYIYNHLGSWWEVTRQNRNALFNIPENSYFSEFMERYFAITPLGSLTNYFTKVGNNKTMCDLIEEQLSAISKAVTKDKPQFIFWHLLITHDPYIYNEYGNCIEEKIFALDNLEERQKIYINHIKHTNAKLIKLYDLVIKQSKRPIIFAIQADEGPYPWSYVTLNKSAQNNYQFLSWNQDELKLKFGIFNAIYLPSKNYQSFNKDFTPINNFRHIFNEIFSRKLPLLKHYSYSFHQEKYPYDLYNITDKLQANLKNKN